MTQNYYYIDSSVSAGQTTLTAIANESANFGIGATTDIIAGIVSSTTLKVGAGITATSGIVTALNGFISAGSTTPIKITLSGNVLSFTAVGIGSTYFTLS
jgi:hypothetical protein